MGVRPVIKDGFVSVADPKVAPYAAFPNSVIALQRAGQPLVAVFYQRQLTPQTLGSGVNRLYLRHHPFGGYAMLAIDNSKGTVTAYPKADWPAR